MESRKTIRRIAASVDWSEVAWAAFVLLYVVSSTLSQIALASVMMYIVSGA